MEHLSNKIGQILGVSPWLDITQDMIDKFAYATLDPDPMHIDPEWCSKNSPYHGTIAFGFLTVALLTYLLHSAMKQQSTQAAKSGGYPLNYGFDRLRLVTPIPVNSRIRGEFKLLEIEDRGNGQHLTKIGATIEVEGKAKPALIAEWLTMWITGDL